MQCLYLKENLDADDVVILKGSHITELDKRASEYVHLESGTVFSTYISLKDITEPAEYETDIIQKGTIHDKLILQNAVLQKAYGAAAAAAAGVCMFRENLAAAAVMLICFGIWYLLHTVEKAQQRNERRRACRITRKQEFMSLKMPVCICQHDECCNTMLLHKEPPPPALLDKIAHDRLCLASACMLLLCGLVTAVYPAESLGIAKDMVTAAMMLVCFPIALLFLIRIIVLWKKH